jgi:ubiquinone biosynthesis protein Coq4
MMFKTILNRALGALGRKPEAQVAQPSRAQRLVEKQRKRYYLKNNLRSVYAVYRLAKNPKGIQYFIMMGDAQDNIGESERRLGRFNDPFKSEALEQMWQSRFDATESYDLEALGKLPADTLGGALARHMKAAGLDQDFYDHSQPRNRMQFLRLRMRQTHDIWHVLTETGTDPFDEVAIQGFVAGQYTSATSAILAAAVFLKAVFRGRFDELQMYVDGFCEGYVAGKRAESLLAVRWEELWGEKVETLRKRYQIQPLRARSRDAKATVRTLKAAA